MKKILGSLLLGVVCLVGTTSQAATVGKKAADKYFQKRDRAPNTAEERVSSKKVSQGSNPRYLAIHFGFFADEDTYKWGDVNDDAGKFTAGVTYRVGEWVNSMDLSFRADFMSFDLKEQRALKLSLMPLVTFPDANSGFPLYFGAGAGAGVFFKQLEGESSLSLDYQLLGGVRLYDIIEDTGFLFEAGLKNHVLLLSDGQFNGVFGSLGVVFNF